MNFRGSSECEASQWKAMIDLIEDVVLLVDDQGTIIHANKRAQELPDAYRKDMINRAIQQKETDPLVNYDGKSYIIRRYLVSDRENYWGTVVLCRDVTELEKMKECYLELDAAVQSSYDGIMITDGKGVVLRFNEAYNRITGIDASEIMGKSMDQLVSKGYTADSVILKVLKNRDTVTAMPAIKSGRKVLSSANPIFDEQGEIFRVIANVRDITELITANSQLEKARELSERYYSELLHLRSLQVENKGIIAESEIMKGIVSTAIKVASTNATVLISGESGVGKEVLARIIHDHSEFKNGPFVKITCSAIPDNLLESELFGYEKGAFTGAASTGKAGLFEIATGGTVFLDEIGELPISMQAKLLGVLQDMQFPRVGGVKPIKMNSRVIAATNRKLDEMVGNEKFRKDLYYRLNVISIKIPALSDRKEDIFPFARKFLAKFNEKYQVHNTISPKVLDAFFQYDWPGNVREMENLIERLVVLSPNEQLALKHLPESMMVTEAKHEMMDGRTLEELIDQAEKNIFQSYLDKGFSTHKIAKQLGVSQPTVFRKIRKYGLR